MFEKGECSHSWETTLLHPLESAPPFTGVAHENGLLISRLDGGVSPLVGQVNIPSQRPTPAEFSEISAQPHLKDPCLALRLSLGSDGLDARRAGHEDLSRPAGDDQTNKKHTDQNTSDSSTSHQKNKERNTRDDGKGKKQLEMISNSDDVSNEFGKVDIPDDFEQSKEDSDNFSQEMQLNLAEQKTVSSLKESSLGLFDWLSDSHQLEDEENDIPSKNLEAQGTLADSVLADNENALALAIAPTNTSSYVDMLIEMDHEEKRGR
ncbi:hypothetical protein ABZP36_032118 [Zizania latifolia]